ncbi:MAG: hypothetical protein ACTS9Y_00405 [Methylophilus sp.]|uniref:hypothetical protein n=1 Tax=Methylophilus sp. TaxID=29541 RepID=UPI003F9FDAC9
MEYGRSKDGMPNCVDHKNDFVGALIFLGVFLILISSAFYQLPQNWPEYSELEPGNVGTFGLIGLIAGGLALLAAFWTFQSWANQKITNSEKGVISKLLEDTVNSGHSLPVELVKNLSEAKTNRNLKVAVASLDEYLKSTETARIESRLAKAVLLSTKSAIEQQ